MQPLCPVCDNELLQPTTVNGLAIDRCERCRGVWLDLVKVQLASELLSSSALLNAARNAPGHCRANHSVPRALTVCPICGAPPVKCPACRTRLSLVSTTAFAISVCLDCRGIWLDAGQIMALRAGGAEKKVENSHRSKGGWEIPPASDINPADDPWRAPGQTDPLPQGLTHIDRTRPFSCRNCGVGMSAYDAWAKDGEMYCAACRPAGAVSAHELPPDLSPTPRALRSEVAKFGDVFSEILSLLSIVTR